MQRYENETFLDYGHSFTSDTAIALNTYFSCLLFQLLNRMWSGKYIEYTTIPSVTDETPKKFGVTSSGDDYIDFANSYLYVQAQITRANNCMAPLCKLPIYYRTTQQFSTQSVLASLTEWNNDYELEKY